MPLDPQARALLDQLAVDASPPPPKPLPASVPEPQIAKVEDISIPGPGPDLPARVYTPKDKGSLPVTVFLHGGGWVGGSIDSVDATCRMLSDRSGSVVVSVGYRLAPLTKFPGPVDDCYAATLWAEQNSVALGGDGSRLAIQGSSAGGNLAAAVTLLARERGGPRLVCQVLVYPVTDQAMGTPTYVEFAEGYRLTAAAMRDNRQNYLRDEKDRMDPLAAPVQAPDLSGLPPALVITSEFDILRHEGEAYAQRLMDAGVPTTLTRYEGMIHTFFNPQVGFDKSFEAIDQAGAALRAAFGS
jgi:acetyl esterase